MQNQLLTVKAHSLTTFIRSKHMWVVRDEVHRRQVGVRRETWVISEWRDGAIERLNLELFTDGVRKRSPYYYVCSRPGQGKR